jgi:hypothetical protein
MADTADNPLAAARQEAASRMAEAWRRERRMDSADDLLARAREAMTVDLYALGTGGAYIELKDAVGELDAMLSSGGPLPSAWKRPPVIATLYATPAVLAERDAKISRLTAELDAARNVPVEYVITAGLEAAMVADPYREDGAILRTTDGKREAWAWKAAVKTWEQVT